MENKVIPLHRDQNSSTVADSLLTPLLDEFRKIVREEIEASRSNVDHSPALLSAESAAKLFDVPKTWISEAARRGELAFVRLGHYVRFRPEDLQSFVEKNRSG